MLISYLCTYKTHNYVNENKGFPKLKKHRFLVVVTFLLEVIHDKVFGKN